MRAIFILVDRQGQEHTERGGLHAKLPLVLSATPVASRLRSALPPELSAYSALCPFTPSTPSLHKDRVTPILPSTRYLYT